MAIFGHRGHGEPDTPPAAADGADPVAEAGADQCWPTQRRPRRPRPGTSTVSRAASRSWTRWSSCSTWNGSRTTCTGGSRRKSPRSRVFGGQVAAQALIAAGRTVPSERRVHSLHAYFLRPGNPRQPIVYQVDRARDGVSFTTRRVVAIQHGKPIFTMSASFQVDEPGRRPRRADADRAATGVAADLRRADRADSRTAWRCGARSRGRSTSVTSTTRPGSHGCPARRSARTAGCGSAPTGCCPTTTCCTCACSRTCPT